MEIPLSSTSPPVILTFCPALFPCLSYSVNFPPAGPELIIFQKGPGISACLSNFSSQFPHIFWRYYLSVMEYKLDCVYNRSIPYIDHSKSLFVARTNRCVRCLRVLFCSSFSPANGGACPAICEGQGNLLAETNRFRAGLQPPTSSLSPRSSHARSHTHTQMSMLTSTPSLSLRCNEGAASTLDSQCSVRSQPTEPLA